MISKEFSPPYLAKTEPITAITMARIIGQPLGNISDPCGVKVLWDGRAADQLAVADGAIVGTYFKEDGVFEDRAKRERVAELMANAKAAR